MTQIQICQLLKKAENTALTAPACLNNKAYRKNVLEPCNHVDKGTCPKPLNRLF